MRNVRNQLHLVRRRWWYVLVAVGLALGAGGLVAARTPPTYAARTTFFVTTPTQGAGEAYHGGLFLQQRVRSYADLLTSDRLAQRVVEAGSAGLSVTQVQSRITAEVEPEKVLLRATVTDHDRQRALRLAQGIATRFTELVQEIERPVDGRTAVVRVEVVRGPRLDATPVSPQPVRNLALAGLVGLLLGAAGAVARGLTDNAVRDGAGLRQATSTALLGQIPYDTDAPTQPLIIGPHAFSARAEAIRQLRTNLRFVDAQEPARVIAVTSAIAGEGKSTVACNLAISLAEGGWRVLLVDADLRRPRVAEYLGLESRIGLTDVLIGEAELTDVLQVWGDQGLRVLPAGSRPPNPSELLGSRGMAEILSNLRELADVVIVDTAPLLAVTDGVVVAVQTDGALLLTRQGSTSRTQAAAAAQALHAVSVRVLGCVLTMARLGRREVQQYETYRAGPAVSMSHPAQRAGGHPLTPGPAVTAGPAPHGVSGRGATPTGQFSRARR